MLAAARNRFWDVVTRALGDADADTDRMLEALTGVQQVRVWVEEVQSACLHLAALPTRQDVRQLHRRVTVLRQRVAELDGALASLEGRLGAEGEAED